jgi:hypothetical protein
MLSKVDNLLLNLPLLSVRPNSLVEGTVLVTVPINLDLSYVDAASSVGFIFISTLGVQLSAWCIKD